MNSNHTSGINGFRFIFRSLQHRNYRLFFVGEGISLVGTWMQRIAISWLVYRLTNSPFLLGLVGFASLIPTFLLTPFTGVLTDHGNRYRIILISQILAMIQAFILAILVLLKIIAVWQIILLSVFLGIISAFELPARQAFLIDMIGNKKELANAIALNSSLFNGTRLIGPSLAGILIATVGEGTCFLVNGISFIAVIGSLLAMKLKPMKMETKSLQIFQSLKEGFFYTFGFAPISSIILLLGLLSLVGMPYIVLMPVFAKDILQGGPHTFGYLMTFSGLGALAGTFYLASRKSVVGLGKIIAISTAIFGLGLIAFSLSRSLPLSLIFVMLTGFGMMVQMASSNTILQTIIEDDKRGRVMSFYTMAFMGTAPFGSLLAGKMAEMIGVTNTLIIGGACCILAALIFAGKLPMFKIMINPIYVKMGIIPEVGVGIQTATDLTSSPEE